MPFTGRKNGFAQICSLQTTSQQPPWITYSFNTKCLSLHNILYYVERGSIFQWSLSFHGCGVEWKEIIKCPVVYPELGGAGGMKGWWLSKTFVGERYVQMSSFCWKDLDRAKFVCNWLPRFFCLLIVVVVISK